MIVRCWPSTRDDQLEADLLQRESPLRANGRSGAARRRPRRATAPAQALVEHRAGSVAVGEQRVAQAVEHRRAEHLPLEVRRAQHGHGREAGVDELELARWSSRQAPK